MLGDYQGALEDLNKVDVFQPNDAITLQMWCDVKILLMDYHESLNDLNKVFFFNPIIMYPLCEDEVGLKLNWWMTKESWMIWMLFNSNMWSFCKNEMKSKKCWGSTIASLVEKHCLFQVPLNNLRSMMQSFC
jgi:hypothetical protein